MGDGIWLVSTTHPILATSTSILAGMNCAPPEAAEKLLTHYLRYLQHVKGHCLVVNPNPTRPGIMHYSDSDWAGLYAYTGEIRSRSGMLVTYNARPISWHSKHQKCKGTAHKEGLDLFHVATASAEAELYAAADAVKACLHLRYIGQELNIAMDPITTRCNSSNRQDTRAQRRRETEANRSSPRLDQAGQRPDTLQSGQDRWGRESGGLVHQATPSRILQGNRRSTHALCAQTDIIMLHNTGKVFIKI